MSNPIRYERKYYRLFKRALLQQVQPALDMLGTGAGEASASAITTEPIKRVYMQLFKDVASKNAAKQYKEIQSQYKATNDFWELTATDFIQQYGTLKIVSITGTSRQAYLDLVRQITIQANSLGLGMYETARIIEREVGKAWADQTFYRAERIARTETGAAANYGTYAGATATGRKDLRKVWKTNIDGRERASHAAANGQQVGIDERFVVGSASLLYPNDYSGPASEIIQCRCQANYITPLNPDYGKA